MNFNYKFKPKEYIKCKYCDYKCLRFYRRRLQQKKLLKHVLLVHEEEVAKALGIEDLLQYEDTIKELEDRTLGDI